MSEEDLREMELALGEIPPEAYLDGPPPGGELLLRRTLDEVRRERSRRVWRNRALLGAAAALAVVVALGAGALIGRSTVPPPEAVATAPARTATSADAGTGVTMTAVVRPAAGWVRIHATVAGVPAGEQCRLVVVSRDGSRAPAGSWMAPDSGRTTVDGSALIAPAEVVAVQAETYAGQILVTVPV
ncbi:RNA polymerase sigma-70 factor (ECF subfamily) [Actinoplanes tereljensis]|uniref:Anti-sigma factor n=1 Tax=Paractinoplanes tereljensis TaxID=571912 RepID=A0A919NHY8_9ACTN|nr:anti-sigma factor [Actinoplanes tereljensis]GIF18999.1 hypothetical protein Ate02nite_17290 [Actinoplanes tereljensis]